MTIGSIEQLLRTALDGSGVVAQRLGAIKAGHPEIAWYPFNSLAKLHLLRMVTDWFDGVDAIPLRTPSQPSVLDVGTADGDLAFVFEAAGCEVTAIDNHHSNNNRCVGVNAMKGYLGSNLEFLDIDIDYDFSVERSFDFLIFLDIFYHLRNPLGAFINLSRAGRYMALSTRICERAPTGDWIADVPCAFLLEPFEAAPNDPTNYWMFTMPGLRRTLDRGGWRVLKEVFFGYGGHDSSPSESLKDKRIICLCERVAGYENLKYGHVIV